MGWYLLHTHSKDERTDEDSRWVAGIGFARSPLAFSVATLRSTLSDSTDMIHVRIAHLPSSSLKNAWRARDLNLLRIHHQE